MEQIIKAYIGIFFVVLISVLGIGLIYTSIVSRNANNIANDYVSKIKNSNLSQSVIDTCIKEINDSDSVYDKLEVNVISDKDNKKSGNLIFTYDYRIPILGLDSKKKIVRYL